MRIFFQLSFILALALPNLASAASCRLHSGPGKPWEGSGACSGNLLREFELPTTGLSLVYNSSAYQVQRGYGSGFTLSIDAFMRTAATSNTMIDKFIDRHMGDGDVSSFVVSDGQWVPFFPSNSFASIKFSENGTLVESYVSGLGREYGVRVAKINVPAALQLLPDNDVTPVAEADKSTYFEYFLTKVWDRGRLRREIKRNPEGRIISVTLPGLQTTGARTISMQYNVSGQLSEIRDFVGTVYRLKYDSSGKLLTLTPSSTLPGIDAKEVIQFAYHSSGRLKSSTFPNATSEAFVYDAAGRISSVIDHKSRRTSYTYDKSYVKTTLASSEIEEQFDSQAALSTRKTDSVSIGYEYDSHLRLSKYTDEWGHVSRFSYLSNSARLVSAFDPSGIEIRLGDFDSDGVYRRRSVLRDGVSLLETTLALGPFKQPISVITNGKTVTLEYDKGDLTSLTNSAGRVIVSASYNLLGLPVSVTEFGKTTTFKYNERGQLIAELGPDGRETHFTPNAIDQNLTIAFPDQSTLESQYDPLGRLVFATKALSLAAGPIKSGMSVMTNPDKSFTVKTLGSIPAKGEFDHLTKFSSEGRFINVQ